MQLSSETISILKNFSTINQSILLRKGDIVSTVSPLKTILARAKVQEQFPVECGIIELNKFLSVLSLFNPQTTTLDFKEKWVDIKDGSKTVQYTYSDTEMFVAAPENELPFPEVDCSFTLEAQALASLLRAISVLQLPQIAIVGEGGNVYVKGIDTSKPTMDTYTDLVGKTNKEFKMVYRVENLKFMQGRYKIDIAKKGITKFTLDDEKLPYNLNYMVVAEADSVFK